MVHPSQFVTPKKNTKNYTLPIRMLSLLVLLIDYGYLTPVNTLIHYQIVSTADWVDQ